MLSVLRGIASRLRLAGSRNRIQDYARRNRGQSLAEPVGLKWRVTPGAVIGPRPSPAPRANPPCAPAKPIAGRDCRDGVRKGSTPPPGYVPRPPLLPRLPRKRAL